MYTVPKTVVFSLSVLILNLDSLGIVETVLLNVDYGMYSFWRIWHNHCSNLSLPKLITWHPTPLPSISIRITLLPYFLIHPTELFDLKCYLVLEVCSPKNLWRTTDQDYTSSFYQLKKIKPFYSKQSIFKISESSWTTRRVMKWHTHLVTISRRVNR